MIGVTIKPSGNGWGVYFVSEAGRLTQVDWVRTRKTAAEIADDLRKKLKGRK